MHGRIRSVWWTWAGVASLIVLTACSGSGSEPTVITALGSATSASSTTTPEPATTTTTTVPKPTTSAGEVSTALVPCAGEFSGTYSGSVSGPVTAVVSETGDITIALATDAGETRFVATSTVEGDTFAFSARANGGGAVEGSFDTATCTAFGSWRDGALQGAWQMGASPLEVRLEADDCAGGVYVGSGEVAISLGGAPITLPSPFAAPADQSITIGQLTVGASGVSVGGETVIGVGDEGVTLLGVDIDLTDEGVVIGDGRVELDGDSIGIGGSSVDFDTLCLSRTVAGHVLTGFSEIADGRIEVRVGTGFTTYGMQAEVLFDFGSDTLNGEAVSVLGEVADSIARRYAQAPVAVIGHTDSIGTDAYNLDLSRRRAAAVAFVLEGDGRLAANPISTYGLGEFQPVAPNTNPDGTDNADGRRLNRRVEIIVDTSGGIGGCVGIYGGSFIGGEGGATGASLRSDGSLEVTFSPVGADPGLVGTAAVGADGTISSTSGVGLSGRFDFSTCTAAGVWEDLGRAGRWNLSR